MHQSFPCRELLGIAEKESEAVVSDGTTEFEARKCVRCKCDLEKIQATKRPSWRKVFERDRVLVFRMVRP